VKNVRNFQTLWTLQVLGLFAERPYSVPELAETLDVSTPAIRRLVDRLVLDEYVEQVPDVWPDRYQLAHGAFAFGLRLVAVGVARTEPFAATTATVGRTLRTYRRRRGLSQEALADLLGVSLPFLGKIERGQRMVSFDEVRRFAERLGEDPFALLLLSPI
jgi:DNA-binding XRE family transcriptional regulator